MRVLILPVNVWCNLLQIVRVFNDVFDYFVVFVCDTLLIEVDSKISDVIFGFFDVADIFTFVFVFSKRNFFGFWNIYFSVGVLVVNVNPFEHHFKIYGPVGKESDVIRITKDFVGLFSYFNSFYKFIFFYIYKLKD